MKLLRYSPLLMSIITFSVYANDYPTLDRVDYVLTCMAKEGGQNVDNLYACSCEVDVIAQKLPYELWVEAKIFASYKRMPGEKGSIFRDSERSDELIPMLEEAEKEAKKRCYVSKRMNKNKKKEEDK